MERLFPLVVLGVLVCAIFSRSSESLDSQLLKLGIFLWPDYSLMRTDLAAPGCNPQMNIGQELRRLKAEWQTQKPDELLEPAPFNEDVVRKSLLASQQLCLEKHQAFRKNRELSTPGVRIYRSIETGIANFSYSFMNNQRLMLALLLFAGALMATLKQQHIAFHSIQTVTDYRLSISTQCLGNFLLTLSAWTYRCITYGSGVAVEHPLILLIFVAGCALMAGINLVQLFFIPQEYQNGGSLKKAFLTIPLYILMLFGAVIYFFMKEGHREGLAIFFSQLFEQSSTFLLIGLYIWSGMLLKQTRLGELIFNIFRPWQLPAELLAFSAILIMAVPTAYTAASGILVLATGDIIYRELRRVGARRQLAWATTAMTGSSGVILRPCLLVVIIAVLNKEVVTSELFGWGKVIFWISALLFLGFALLTKKEPFRIASVEKAWPEFIKALRALGPYFAITAGVLVFYRWVLNLRLDEHSAPIILPVIVLAMIFFESRSGKKKRADPALCGRSRVQASLKDTAIHAGALLTLIGLSFAVGGIIERSGLFQLLPEHFGAPVLTITFLVVIFILIGMFMDPFGATVLVSGTVAMVAYKNGINPVHFWMIALVAFELGYLTPPVALNQLLTRQIIGEKEAQEVVREGDGFWYRHERILLPIAVMGTTLLIVAYAPLLWAYR